MLLEGQQIDRYRFLRLLGSGGMGNVYLAEDARIEQQVAVKVIRGEGTLYPNTILPQDGIRLFRREAKAIAKLDHPNILPLFDYGEDCLGDTTVIYLVMPYRQEGSLASWLRQGRTTELLSHQEIDHIVRQAAESLQHAHNRQIIHQDVKPSNFLLRQREDNTSPPDILLADFGIAHFMTAISSTSQSIRGTPIYMAPEQWKGEPVFATDQYALAVMTYELLTGQPPFQGGPGRMMYQHINVEPPPPSTINPRLSQEIDEVLLRALAKKPEQRFTSITEFANAFQQAIQNRQNDHAPTLPASSKTPLSKDKNGTVPAITIMEGNVPTVYSSASEQSLHAESNKLTETQPAAIMHTSTQPAAASADSSAMEAPSISMMEPNPSPEHESNSIASHRRAKRQSLLVLALVALVVLLVFGSMAYASHGILPSLPKNVVGTFSAAPAGPHPASSATLKITPASSHLAKTYTILAVPGSPNASQHQVAARLLSYTTQTQAQTVKATGQGTTPGTHASGTVLIDNFDTSSSLTLTAGSIFTNTYGASTHMVLDATMTVPAAPSNTTWSQRSVPGHILEVGSIGNNEFNNNISGSISYSVFNNPPFSNGIDPQNYTFVQQSDIDNEANALTNANTPNPQQVLQPQIRANERLIGIPPCKSNVTSNPAAGDKATSVTVTVSFTCAGEVYDEDGARTMAESMLKDQASTELGSGYVLVGNVKTAVNSATVTDARRGMITLTVSVEEVWVYQFSDAQKQAMAKLIAGKNENDANMLLLKQRGVKQADIRLAVGYGNTLPADAGQITVVVESVAGVQ
ncbi:MAG: serine/threonine protein kinase [Ktedonobacteraceae bacterium]